MAAATELSPAQQDLHDAIDEAVDANNGYGAAFTRRVPSGATHAIAMYAKKHPHVVMEVDTSGLVFDTLGKYPFLKGRVFVQWRTPVDSTTTLIVVDRPTPRDPPKDLPILRVPRFVVFQDYNPETFTSPRIVFRFGDFDEAVSLYARLCGTEESTVCDWFGCRMGRTIKAASSKDDN